MRRTRAWAAITATIMAVSALVATTPAQAADISRFDPGMIISDEVFFDPMTMSVAEIQAFLDGRVTTCRSGYVCLKDYRTDSPARTADPMCRAYAGGRQETAAQIIHNVSVACGINPQVLIVLLQKEQGLVTSSTPSTYAYRSATGYGCPDTAACDSRYYGLANQIYMAAWAFKRYTMPPGTGPGTAWSSVFSRYRAGQWADVLYHPNSACGSSRVFIQNKATASLYFYTPYQPNGAALRAYYGVGDGCSAYGNRNFFLYFNDWFESSTYLGPIKIDSAYAALGGAGGVLGAPTGGHRAVGGGTVRDYSGGRIHYSIATGAHAVYAPVGARYDALQGESGTLGYPIRDRRAAAGGVVQDFQFGRIHASEATGAWETTGLIGVQYDSLSGESGALGFPMSAATTTGGVRSQAFQNGVVIERGARAIEVVGPIWSAFSAAGGASGPLGYPTASPRAAAGGSVQDFERGRIHGTAGTGWWILSGAIGTEYDRAGGESGALGFPVGAATTVAGVTAQEFQRGRIVSSAVGTWLLTGSISDRYGRADTAREALGLPVAAARVVQGGAVQDFQGGRIHAETGRPAYAVTGAIGRAYDAARGESGPIGFPVAEARSVGEGVVQDFRTGRIHWSPATGAHVVSGAIGGRYDRLRGESGPLGWPVAAQRITPGGFTQDFQNGRIHASSRTGAWEVSGAVGVAYDSVRGESGSLGYPVAAARAVTGGTVQDFENGRIHGTETTGYWPVSGSIGRAYDAVAGESGRLGFPISAQYPSGQGQRQDFQSGSIVVSTTGTVSIIAG